MTDPIPAPIGADMHRFERDVDAGKTLAGETAQCSIVIAGNVGHAGSACGDREDFREHGAVLGMPPGLELEVFQIDDIADQVESLTGRRLQEVEQVGGLAIAQAQVYIRDEDAAKALSRHGRGSVVSPAQPMLKV